MFKQFSTWAPRNKLLIIFIVLTLVFLVSTLTLALHPKGRANQAERHLLQGPIEKKVYSIDQNYYRLPRKAVPQNYNLTLIPKLKEDYFDGVVIISVQVLESCHNITLHNNKLVIHTVEMTKTSDQKKQYPEVSSSSDAREFLYLTFKQNVEPGLYLLRIEFRGNLPKKSVGIYKSTLRTGQLIKSYSAMENLPFKVNLSERLSTLVKPVNYNLVLHPDLETGLFEGSVTIKVNVKQEKNYINLHSLYLNIKDVKVFRGAKEVSVAKFLEIKHIEQLLIAFNETISSGSYDIVIDFSGDLTRNLVGIYLSRLNDQRAMVASKFEPTYARQAFPCFDEPDLKATYDITLVAPSTHTALSNMNEISKTTDPVTNLDTVKFATSVPMSTYLACFVICDFHFKEDEINANGVGHNFVLRSFAQKHEMHKIDFAQDIGKRATEFYIKYYDVPFPLPKLDMIAIPDYISGATEHWGLITYRETSFLVDLETASSKNKVAVANTIAHELAHMWFGNLVTLKWWDELWLNEGFASYMQVKAINAIEPSWTMLDQFLLKNLHKVLVFDSKLSSHPIVQTVATPDQITAIFDTITYSKGSSILRMLEGFIGAENFRKGVSDYLKKFEFGNTVTQDLLACLTPYFETEKNQGLNLSHIMDTWTKQMGYPVLTVSRAEEPHTFVITQKRFLQNPNAKSPNDSPFNYRWFVPITYKTDVRINENILWFPDIAENVKLTLASTEKWLKINNNQVGFYRVNYPDDMWYMLTEQLKKKDEQFTISDRAHLLNDAFALADAQLVSYDVALNLTSYLTVEEDYVPWSTLVGIYGVLGDRLLHTSAADDLESYFQSLVKPLYEKQNWESTKHSVIQGLLRTTILSFAMRTGLKDAQENGRKMFLNWLNNYGTPESAPIESDLREFVYRNGMVSANETEWEKLWQIYLKTEDAHEQNKLRSALASPDDPNLLKRYLTLAWNEKYVRSQDYLNVIQHIADNPIGQSLVWNDVRNRWPELVDRFTLNNRYLGNLIPGITSNFNTEKQLQEMKDFFAKYPEAGAGEGARKVALETVTNNIRWSQNNYAKIASWLKTRNANQ